MYRICEIYKNLLKAWDPKNCTSTFGSFTTSVRKFQILIVKK